MTAAEATRGRSSQLARPGVPLELDVAFGEGDSGERRPSKLSALVALGKVRLAAMAVFAVLAGAMAGAAGMPGASAGWGLLVPLGLGSFLVAVSGHALNMLIERDADARMPRTATRPLPAGLVSPGEALAFGLATLVLGLGIMAWNLPPLATGLCGAILVSYVLVYTPLKPVTELNTLVGAVPGALPPVVGYAAATGTVDLRAASLFLILFFWQIPHFLAISWRYRDDYARGGMKMLAVSDPAGGRVGFQMVVYCVALVASSTLPFALRMAGEVYLIVAVWLGVMFLVPCVAAALLRSRKAMLQAFLVSILYLPLLLCALVLDSGAVDLGI